MRRKRLWPSKEEASRVGGGPAPSEHGGSNAGCSFNSTPGDMLASESGDLWNIGPMGVISNQLWSTEWRELWQEEKWSGGRELRRHQDMPLPSQAYRLLSFQHRSKVGAESSVKTRTTTAAGCSLLCDPADGAHWPAAAWQVNWSRIEFSSSIMDHGADQTPRHRAVVSS